MSSSKPESMIVLHANEKEVTKKIMGAFCPRQKEGNPIYQIIKFHVFPTFGKLVIKRDKKYGGDMTFKSMEDFDKGFAKIHPADLKNATADAVVKMLKPVRDYFKKNPKYLKALK